MPSPELKPCPFCGGTNLKIYEFAEPGWACAHSKTGYTAEVVCATCFYERGFSVAVRLRHAIPHKPKESWARCKSRADAAAVAAWNKRANEEAAK